MLDKFEFDDVKKLRKSLLITSTGIILLSKLIDNSVGEIELLGFNIPSEKSDFLLHFFGYVIIFFTVALIIRYTNEEFRKLYKKKLDSKSDLEVFGKMIVGKESAEKIRYYAIGRSVIKKINWFVVALDIVFPIVLGVITLFYCF